MTIRELVARNRLTSARPTICCQGRTSAAIIPTRSAKFVCAIGATCIQVLPIQARLLAGEPADKATSPQVDKPAELRANSSSSVEGAVRSIQANREDILSSYTRIGSKEPSADGRARIDHTLRVGSSDIVGSAGLPVSCVGVVCANR